MGGRGDEWIEVAQAAGGVAARGMPDVAIRLLPHLKKTVQHVLGIGIVRQSLARARVFRRHLKGTVGQQRHVGDAGVRAARREKAACAGGEQRRVRWQEAWFDGLGDSHGGKGWRIGVTARRRNAAQVGRRQRHICGLAAIGRADEILSLRQDRELGRGLEVGTWSAVLLDDAARQQIVDALTIAWFVDAEDMIKATVLSDDHDHVLDWCCGFDRLRAIFTARRHSEGAECNHGGTEDDASVGHNFPPRLITIR